MTLSHHARSFGRCALAVLFPPACIACGAQTQSDGALCAACWREAEFLDGAVCDRCGAPVPDGDDELICDECLRFPPVWGRGRAALLYSGSGRRLVLAYKHGDRLDATAPLARWMARAGRELIVDADLIAPTPLHWLRRMRRRYNQSAELARALTRDSGLVAGIFAPDLMIRARRTASQDGKSRMERFENVVDAFRIAPRWRDKLIGKRVLLIDDVVTTGATFSACAQTCFAAGAAEVDVLALTHVARRE